ncbi:MAG: amino acid ABC transporter permease [Oscillospiraceae bacterium]|nr:amino acid ABC transporter permease [Oscillospiraceae bacterium]
MNAWFEKLHETFIESGLFYLIPEGFRNSFIITLGALCIGVFIGTLIAVVKYFWDDVPAMKPIVKLCDLYVTVIRGIPMVVLLLIFYYIILVRLDGVEVGIIAFGINSGAYMAELIRSGINAVDRGQMEAGRSLGMSKLQCTRLIIVPQAVRYILPAIGNEMIALLKETSVAGYVAVVDLTRGINLIRNNTHDNYNTLFALALVYLVLVVILTQIIRLIERRLGNRDKGRKPAKKL